MDSPNKVDILPFNDEQRRSILVNALYGSRVVPDPYRFTESCIMKMPVQLLFGGLLGGAMGIFFGQSSPLVIPNGTPPPPERSLKQTMHLEFQKTKKSARMWSKNMAMIGALFGTTECYIEKYRAKHDIINPTLAGCASGAVLGAKGGAQSALLGCGGFAAFSAAMELLLVEMR